MTLVIKHAINTEAAKGAPDGKIIDQALAGTFDRTDREKEKAQVTFESSPRAGGERATGNIDYLHKSTDARRPEAAADGHRSDESGSSVEQVEARGGRRNH